VFNLQLRVRARLGEFDKCIEHVAYQSAWARDVAYCIITSDYNEFVDMIVGEMRPVLYTQDARDMRTKGEVLLLLWARWLRKYRHFLMHRSGR